MFADNELTPRFLPLSPHTCGRHWWLFLEVTYPSPPDNTHTHRACSLPPFVPQGNPKLTSHPLPLKTHRHTHNLHAHGSVYLHLLPLSPPLSFSLTHTFIIIIYFMLVWRAEEARQAEFSITAICWWWCSLRISSPSKSSLETVGTTTAINVSARSIKNWTGESSCSPDPAVPGSNTWLT